MEFSAIIIGITIVAGFGIGIMSGLIGIGGGMIIIPFLNVGLGIPILNATSTSLFTVFFTSASGAIQHVRNKTANLKLALALSIPSLVFTPLGALFSIAMSPTALSCIVAAILLFPLTQSVISAVKQRKEQTSDAAHEITWSETALTHKEITICICGGAITGFLSGMVGLGGGFLIIPLLSAFLKRGMHEVTATSMVFIFVTSIVGTITHAIAGDIIWILGILLVIGSIPGAIIGAKLSKKVDGFYLKLAVILVTVTSLSLILWRAFA